MSVGSLITRYLPGRPQGDPSAIRSAANYWTMTANGLRSAVDDATTRINSASGSWQGAAKAAFEHEWTTLANAVREGADEVGNLAGTLNQAASQIEDAQRRYEMVMIAAAATAGIAIATTFITFGASEAVEGGAIAAEAAAAAEAGVEAATAAEVAMSTAVSIAQQIAVRFVVFTGVDLAAQAGVAAVIFPDHNPFSHLDPGAAIGIGAGLAVPALAGEGVASNVVVSGLTGTGIDAVTQEVTTGKIDPIEALFSGATAGVTAGVLTGGGRIFGSLGADAGSVSAAAGVAADIQDAGAGMASFDASGPLVPGGTDGIAPEAARTPAQVAADGAVTAGKTSGAAAQFDVGGQTFVDVSGSSTQLEPEVQTALDSVPRSLRPKWHGGCAEPRCLSQALRAGVDPAAGEMTAVQIGENGLVPHGAVRSPCPSCQILRDIFGYIQ